MFSPGSVDGRPGRRWSRLVLRVGLGIVAVGLLYVVVTFVQVWWVSRQDSLANADAIVVMGAAQYNGTPSPALQGRLDHALTLWQDGRAPLIVVTGGRRVGDRTTEAKTGYDYLRERAVPDEALRLEVSGTNTWESLAASRRFLRAEGIERVLIVSDAYHAMRVQGTAAELGLDAAVSPVDPGSASIARLTRETAAVSLGRIIGYRRLLRLRGS